MSRRVSSLPLTDQECADLRGILRRGMLAARTLARAQILLLSATGEHTVAEIAQVLHVAPATVYNVRARYRSGGLESALLERPRPGAPRRVTAREEAHITTIACSTPPTGQGRWTIQLIADQLVELTGTPVSRESVRRVLKKVRSNRGRSGSGALGR